MPSHPHPQNLLSPAELSFLHTSLSQTPPIRPDARTPTQFRPLVAETNILPGTNGSARICFADGTEAIVGVKAEVERTTTPTTIASPLEGGGPSEGNEGSDGSSSSSRWVDLTIELPGYRDDDALPIFLSAMLHESLVTGGELAGKLVISPGWHWKLYVDVLLLSLPLSYPVPLLSLTIHLALLSTRLPALKSQQDEDPFFNDDWDASTFIYPTEEPIRPSVTLLVASIGPNTLFDPSREEIAVADALLAVSISRVQGNDKNKGQSGQGQLRLLSIRTIDLPSRLTPAGMSNEESMSSLGAATGAVGAGGTAAETSKITSTETGDQSQGLWTPRRGGMPRTLIPSVLEACLATGGVGDEVLTALQAVEVG